MYLSKSDGIRSIGVKAYALYPVGDLILFDPEEDGNIIGTVSLTGRIEVGPYHRILLTPELNISTPTGSGPTKLFRDLLADEGPALLAGAGIVGEEAYGDIRYIILCIHGGDARETYPPPSPSRVCV